MSIATTMAAVSCAAAATAASSRRQENQHNAKYDIWIFLGITVIVVGSVLLCYYWPW